MISFALRFRSDWLSFPNPLTGQIPSEMDLAELAVAEAERKES